MSNSSALWLPKHLREGAELDDDFWVPGAKESVDDDGNRVGKAIWVARAEVQDIPDYVWRRVPEPAGWVIVVQEFMPPEKTKGGVLMVDESKQYHTAGNYIGRVLALGPSCYRHPKFVIIDDSGSKVLQAPWCAPGEWITFAQYTGTPRTIKYKGKEWRFRFVFDENIQGRAPTPDGLMVYLS